MAPAGDGRHPRPRAARRVRRRHPALPHVLRGVPAGAAGTRGRATGGGMRRLVETDAHEGPVYVAEEDALYFTTARPDVEIRRLAVGTGEVTTVRPRTGVANGMTLNHDGSLLVCEQQP